MGYQEKVLEKINAVEQRVDERRALWQAAVQKFEKEGADGVANGLAGQMDGIQTQFEARLRKLDAML